MKIIRIEISRSSNSYRLQLMFHHHYYYIDWRKGSVPRSTHERKYGSFMVHKQLGKLLGIPIESHLKPGSFASLAPIKLEAPKVTVVLLDSTCITTLPVWWRMLELTYVKCDPDTSLMSTLISWLWKNRMGGVTGALGDINRCGFVTK